ncbi:MAG TPA: formate dehydrogenase subunit gamma [Steroidobacteraceae bacterium]|nr:formate dehydrogenase subunit gamma [Steroidobacteraceae bacterium]
MSEPASPRLLERHTSAERTTHWTLALAFVLAALSGLALFHPALFWLSELFGGGPWTRILHPYVALIAVVVFLKFAADLWDDARLTPADRQWLRQMQDVIHNREDRLPEVGRYNAGQKLLFWVLFAGMLGLLLSGIVMWRSWFGLYFSVGLIRVASLVHAVCAFVLVCGIIVHVYSAFWIKGSIEGMVRGTVTAGWAWKHHRAWFRQVTHDAHPRTRPN